jgi:16S rRNA (cytosine1402-N4)-methyltransferase
MEYSHKSVLPAEVVRELRCSRGHTIVDCTLGGAGHSEKILANIAPEGFLLGIDKDDAVIDAARVRLARFSRHFELYRGSFADIDKILTQAKIVEVDGFLLDLGLSSLQLGDPARGFTYQVDAPLDMRFNQDQDLTAERIVNEYARDRLTAVIKDYGEEKWASRIAAFIVRERERRPITRTSQLVEVIKAAVPAAARRAGGHPAKRTFQALRIEVNGEIEALRQVLDRMPKWLASGGRIAVISYHSLEDRLVKHKFREAARGCVCPPELAVCVCGLKPILRIVTSKPIVPTPEEIQANPRARSAKMRVAEKVN